VRVLGFEDASAAPSRGVAKGDQLVIVGGESVVGTSLGDAMMLFGAARQQFGSGSDLSLVLFRGTANELQDVISAAAAKAGKELGPMRFDTGEGTNSVTVTVTDESKGGKVTVLNCAPGTNLRDLLLANAINPYRNVARFSNCSGKQLCGTCIVDVTKNAVECTSVKGLDEASTLRSNPDTYRLSCVTDVYGDVAVTVGCKVGAEQWTR
jgi:ferredoxin